MCLKKYINISEGRVTHMTNCWTFDKPMASLSTSYLGVLPWMVTLLNLDGTAVFEQLINIARFFKKLRFMRMCVSMCIIQSSRSLITDMLLVTISYIQ